MLSSARITLRPPEPADVDTLYRWENNPEVWNVGNTVAPYSRKLLWEYIDTYEADIFKSRQLRFIIEINDGHEPVGTVDLFDFDPVNSRCGVGILVIPAFRKVGIASEALDLVISYCRRRLSLHQLYCTIGATNTISMALFSSIGFSVVGHMKSWLKDGASYEDAYLCQMLL